MNTTNLLIKINHHFHINQPDYLKHNNAIIIQSPVNLTLKPRSDAWIDLLFNIEHNFNYKHSLWLKPSTVFGSIGLDIEDKDMWFKNLTKNNTIMIHLRNISFHYDVNIKKNDIIAYCFILEKTADDNVIINYKIKD